ncbi:MAG: DedA family protein [Verrucomicrobia bacterium]|nr:DedA family protein [Verrucomicrobiota bacterium]
MENLTKIPWIILHLNLYVEQLVSSYGSWIYAVLFIVILCETGLVVTPFLPGDALLFTVGTMTGAEGSLNLPFTLMLLSLAAVLGDSINYTIGASLGERLFKDPNSRIFNRRYLEQTHRFYEKHGAKTIVLARFLPIIRTFAPFIAGMGSMQYRRFLRYNLAGAFIWVFSVVLLGHFFGKIPFVQKNFSLVIIAIILISMIPPEIEFWRGWNDRSIA